MTDSAEQQQQPPTGPVSGPTTGVDRLVAAGVVDREFCEAQTGRAFRDERAAAGHFARHGTFSPHPLVDLAGLPTWLRESLLRGETSALLGYLRRAGSERHLSPAFDAAAVPGSPEEKTAHPGGALGLFLSTADDRTLLPGHTHLTFGRLREAVLDRARLVTKQARATGSRIDEQWDEAAEQRWTARWTDAPLPVVDGPLVSVLMPVRNRAGVVATALASLAEQSLESWELVVVDDGSTDDTPAVLDRWAAHDPRIRVVRQSWGGVSAARNRALSEARGRYVAFLDSDNTWRPDFLRLALAAMHGQGLRAAYAAMALRDHGDPADPDRIVHRAFQGSLPELLVVNHVDLNVLVAERDLVREVGGFDETLRRWVDHDLALRLARRVELRLLPFVGVDYDNSMTAPDRITTTESSSWQYVVLGRHWVDWDAVERDAGQRVPGRVSVLMPTWNDAAMTRRAVAALIRHTPDVDLEVVVVDNGSRPEFGLFLAAAFAGEPRVHYERLPRNLNFAIGSNVAFAHSTGELVVFLNNDTEVRPGWWAPIAGHLTGPSADPDVLGVQPLLLYPDDTIQSAGTVFPVDDGLPCHYLVDHPVEDAAKIADPQFHAVTAAALAMRAGDVARLRGFDPIYVSGNEDIDLCLRAAELHPGGVFVVETRSRVTHHEGRTNGRDTEVMEDRANFWHRWRGRVPARDRRRWVEAGFAVAHTGGEPVPYPRAQLIVVRPHPEPPAGGGAPALRWGIRLPSVPGEGGDAWGDTHFAASLAASLGALGQEVVSFRHGAHHGPATRLDDVVLGIRGLDVIYPVPGKVNVLWVISHPDDVTPAELMGFDLIYAASASWAEQMAARSGLPVEVLLQATDLRLRADLSRPVGAGTRPLFVGMTKPGRARPVVHDALEAGLPVEVHGPGWAGLVPTGTVASTYVANHELMALYRDRGLVLADHWGDMAREGFLANRLFDAVASGARVVTDDVPGTEVFGGAVQVYRSVEELAALCGPGGRDRFPDAVEMARISDRVAAEHSFNRRAEQLLGDVLPRWERLWR